MGRGSHVSSHAGVNARCVGTSSSKSGRGAQRLWGALSWRAVLVGDTWCENEAGEMVGTG